MAKRKYSVDTIRRVAGICDSLGLAAAQELTSIIKDNELPDGVVDVDKMVSQACVLAIGLTAQIMREALLYSHDYDNITVKTAFENIKWMCGYVKFNPVKKS